MLRRIKRSLDPFVQQLEAMIPSRKNPASGGSHSKASMATGTASSTSLAYGSTEQPSLNAGLAPPPEEQGDDRAQQVHDRSYEDHIDGSVQDRVK